MNPNLRIADWPAKLLRAVWRPFGVILAMLLVALLAIILGVIYEKGK